MRAPGIWERAQLAWAVIWVATCVLLVVAGRIRPTETGLIHWLETDPSATGGRLAAELPLRLSRLSFPEELDVIEHPAFASALSRLDSGAYRSFVRSAAPECVRSLMAQTRALPASERSAFFKRATAILKRQISPDDIRTAGLHLRELAERGAAIYQDEAPAEDREVMAPYIRQLSELTEWL